MPAAPKGSEKCQKGLHSTCQSPQCKSNGCMCHRYRTGWCSDGSTQHSLCSGIVRNGRPRVPKEVKGWENETRDVKCHCTCHNAEQLVAKAIASIRL